MMRRMRRQWYGGGVFSDTNPGCLRRCLAVVLMVMVCTPTLALAQQSIAARPSLEDQRAIAGLIDQTLPQFDIDPQQLPGRFRRQVVQRIYDYAVLYRADMQEMLKRAALLLPMIKRTFQNHDLPIYFAYIPLVESRFRVDAAHSQSGARGLWQLMPITARGYGLQVSSHIDERLDPQRATQAAARYLQKLQKRFGTDNPLCILAAYNYGGGNVAKSMRRARSRDIIHLYTYRRLPYETREYLIKMVAFWVVMAHVDRFDLVPTRLPSSYVAADLSPMQVAMDQDTPSLQNTRMD